MTLEDGAPVRAVLFDLDGTLVDSEPLIGAALAETLARHGFAFDPSTVGRVVGPPMTLMIQHITGVSDAVAAQLFEEYARCYLERHAPRTQPLPGAIELLDALATAGIPLALVTNKHERSARTVLGYLGWSERFAAVGGADSVSRVKPDAAHALEVARALGVPVGQAALVGDLDVDMACGRAASLPRVIGLAGGMSAEELRAAGATHVATSLNEVGRHLGLASLPTIGAT
ncbi:MAG: HAD family hydrolase [Dehalococcoidia bacterium]|nr:HAD family hydrolase [Dehalococcoidia bacterium]